MSFLHRFALAWVLGSGVDLALSAAGGYTLRTEPLRLALVNTALVGALVLATSAGIEVLGWLSRRWWTPRSTPWTSTILAAWAPLGAARVAQAQEAVTIIVFAAGFAALAAAGRAEARRRANALSCGPVLTLLATSSIIAVVALRPPTPGHGMLERPLAVAPPPATKEEPNVILIVLDTTRADHLSAYGYPRPTSPALSRFASKSTVYEHAVSSSSYTLPAHASLFTGLHVGAHGADVVEDGRGVSLGELGIREDWTAVRPLSPEATTLAEIAQEAGLETGAICANSAFLYRAFGLDQGFDTYVDARGITVSRRPAGLAFARRFFDDHSWEIRRLLDANERYYLLAAEVNDLALRWLEPRRDRRFFLFLNYMDPHHPYLPVGPYRDLFPHASEPLRVDYHAIAEGERSILDEERARLVDAYDAEIRYLDDHLGRLFAKLGEWGLLENSVVVVTGDHGESLGEHDRFAHGVSLYEAETRVPLIVRSPGQTEGRRERGTRQITGVFPTLLERIGVAAPAGVEGHPLRSASADRAVFATLGPYKRPESYEAVWRGRWKLIRSSGGTVELYDLEADPGEERDLSAEERETVNALTGELDRHRQITKRRFPDAPDDPTRTGEETIDRLRALGYVR